MKIKINSEIIKAMKSKETFRLSVLRMMKSQLEEEAKKVGTHRPDLDVIQAYSKKLEKGLEIKNLPQDFIDKTKNEIKIIQEFLPKEATVQEMLDMLKDHNFIDKSEVFNHLKEQCKLKNLMYSGKLGFEVYNLWAGTNKK